VQAVGRTPGDNQLTFEIYNYNAGVEIGWSVFISEKNNFYSKNALSY
jgi:hypothetical protein